MVQHLRADLHRVLAAALVVRERRVHGALHAHGAVHLQREQRLVLAVRARLLQRGVWCGSVRHTAFMNGEHSEKKSFGCM
jgi:hypothetical protein